MQRVAVIGAGAAGLCAARYLSAKPNSFETVVFEKADCIGGTWVYTEETGTDKYGLPIHSSMYKNLRTNLPKEVMAFPDLPFDKSLPSFVSHTDVLQYLEQYAAHFHLLQYIKFNTVVECVKPITNGTKTLWEVTVRDLTDKVNGIQTSIFDGVIVCNGHYSVPNTPKLKGQETFTGTIMHSHNYRIPEEFRDSTVVCIGAGFSGQDMVLDMHPYAKMVYLSHWGPTLLSEFPKNVAQVPVIDYIDGNKVTFTDGQTCEADTILLCTGYEYTFPFLSKECQLTIDKEQTMSPLYKYLIHADHPSLSFVGLCGYIVPFPQYSVQVRFIVAILKGEFKLPSKEEIEAENELDLQKRLDMGWPRRYAHKLGPLQWEYSDQIAKLAGTKPINPVIQKLGVEVDDQRLNHVLHYKKINYELVDEDNWREIKHHGSGDAGVL